MPWAGQFEDRNGAKLVIAEVTAGHDTHFWHVFKGCPGSMNDLNVMGVSTLSMVYIDSAPSK